MHTYMHTIFLFRQLNAFTCRSLYFRCLITEYVFLSIRRSVIQAHRAIAIVLALVELCQCQCIGGIWLGHIQQNEHGTNATETETYAYTCTCTEAQQSEAKHFIFFLKTTNVFL